MKHIFRNMRTAFLLTTVLLLSAANEKTMAQSAWIEGKLTNFSSAAQPERIYLMRPGLLRTTEMVDSVLVNAQGEFEFQAMQDDFPALYQLQFNNGTPVSFLCTAKGQVKISSTPTDFFYGNAAVKGAPENELYNQLRQLKAQNEAAQQTLGTAYDAIDFFDPKYNTRSEKVRAEYEALLIRSNRGIDLLMRQNKGTFVADVLAPLYYSPLKQERSETDTFYDNNLAFQHNHFLDGMDMNDIRLTSFDIYYDRLDEYMANYIDGSSLDGLIDGVTQIMKRISDSEIQATVALYLSDKAKKVKQHDLADYILDTYYVSGCNVAIANNWNEIVSTIRAASVGSFAPELALPNVSGKETKLSSVQGKKAVLLYFWSSHCQYCLDGLPELKQFYNTNAAKGFEIYAVSLDDDREVWQQFVIAANLSWVNVCDGKGSDGEQAMVYGLRGTPTYFLLDGNMKIQLRTHDLHELMNSVIQKLTP